MAWDLQWSEEALRDLSDLDLAVAQRIILAVERTASDPPRTFKRLKGSDDHRLRVGDWRVLATLAHKAKVVFLKRIGHRSVVYR